MPFLLLRVSFTRITSPHTLKQLKMKRQARTAPTMLTTDMEIRGANGLIGCVTVLASMSSRVLSTITFRQSSLNVYHRSKVAHSLPRFAYGGLASSDTSPKRALDRSVRSP